MTESTIHTTLHNHAINLSSDNSLTIQEVDTDNRVLLSPAVVAALYEFFQRTEVQYRLDESKAALKDPVTGLFNQRYLHDVLTNTLKRVATIQRPVGVMVIETDHFRHFDETYGHFASDTLLRVLGAFLQMGIRSEDIACRYGNEGFVLVLPGASPVDTQRRAEVLRDGASHLHLQHDNQVLGSVTISVGIAGFPDHGTTATELIHAAEQAMYRAKAEGHDRVIIYTPN